MPSTSSQIEFKNLPPRTAPAPVEDVSELEEVLCGLLLAQTPPQKVETSQQLICAALRGEELHVLIGPPRLHIGRMNGGLKRTIKLSRETVVRTILRVLIGRNAPEPRALQEEHSRETVSRQTSKQTDYILCSPKSQSPCSKEKARSTWLSAGKMTPNCGSASM